MSATLNARLANLDRATLVQLSKELVSDEQAGEPQWQAYLSRQHIADVIGQFATDTEIEAALEGYTNA